VAVACRRSNELARPPFACGWCEPCLVKSKFSNLRSLASPFFGLIGPIGHSPTASAHAARVAKMRRTLPLCVNLTIALPLGPVNTHGSPESAAMWHSRRTICPSWRRAKTSATVSTGIAMDEHQKPVWRGFGQKEVETVARSRTVRDAGPGSLPHGRAKCRRFSRPARRECFSAGDEGAVGVGAVEIQSRLLGFERHLMKTLHCRPSA
jgi:hypothetical protein